MKSKQTDAEAYERCKNDPRYFIERFFWIVGQNKKHMPFLLNPPQQKYYDNRTNNDLILKDRKQGFSTLIEALNLHACLFFDNENAVTMAHTMEDTIIHLDRVRYFLSTMGLKDLRVEMPIDKDNQREIYMPLTHSRYWIGTAGSRAFGRGRDVTRLHLSELAHYQDQSVVTGILEACVPGAYKAFETTANGVGEMFHRLWKESEDVSSRSPWKRHFFAWFESPANRVKVDGAIGKLSSKEVSMKKAFGLDDEQIMWHRTKYSEMPDKSLMAQEHPSTPEEAFISSGMHPFNLEKVSAKKSAALKAPPLERGYVEDDGVKVSFVSNGDGPLRVWKMPRKVRKYLISADVAQGVAGGNWSVGQVFDRASWEQVAVYRIRIDPGTWGRTLVSLARFYNNAVIVPESNSIGAATIEAIKSAEYPHLLNTKELWGDKEVPRDGFPTNDKTRGYLTTALRNSIDDDTVHWNDPTTLGEFETFVVNKETGKMEAQKGCEDDCVLSAGIGVYCLKFLTVDESYREEERVPEWFAHRVHKEPASACSRAGY